jgi:hypothetical protein
MNLDQLISLVYIVLNRSIDNPTVIAIYKKTDKIVDGIINKLDPNVY